MSYNANKPSGSDYLKTSSGDVRENFRAIKEDAIVNALKLYGLSDTSFMLKDGTTSLIALLTYLNSVTASANNDIPSYGNVQTYTANQSFAKRDALVSFSAILKYIDGVSATSDLNIPTYKNILDYFNTKLSSSDTSVTKQGNTFNGNSQLVQLTAGGKYPALDGSNITNLSSSNAKSFPAYKVNSGALDDIKCGMVMTTQDFSTIKFGIDAYNIKAYSSYTSVTSNSSYMYNGGFGNNGYYYYYAVANVVYRLTLAVPYNLSINNITSTITFTTAVAISNLYGIKVSSNGLYIYAYGANSSGVMYMYQWTVATAWALPANATAPTYSLASAAYNHGQAFNVSANLKYLYVITNGYFYQYTMSTLGRISTATVLNASYDIQAKVNRSFSVSPNGTEIYYVHTSNTVNRLKTSTVYDFATLLALNYGSALQSEGSGIILTPNGILYEFISSTTIHKYSANIAPTIITFPNNKTYCIESISDLTVNSSGIIIIKESNLVSTGSSTTLDGITYPTYTATATLITNTITEADTQPAIVNGNRWLDISGSPYTPKLCDGADYDTIEQFVKIGYVTYSSIITSLGTYAFNGIYISPVVPTAVNVSQAFTDNLGTLNKTIKVKTRQNWGYCWSFVTKLHGQYYGGFAPTILNENAVNLSVTTSGGYVAHGNFQGLESFPTAGYISAGEAQVVVQSLI